MFYYCLRDNVSRDSLNVFDCYRPVCTIPESYFPKLFKERKEPPANAKISALTAEQWWNLESQKIPNAHRGCGLTRSSCLGNCFAVHRLSSVKRKNPSATGAQWGLRQELAFEWNLEGYLTWHWILEVSGGLGGLAGGRKRNASSREGGTSG